MTKKAKDTPKSFVEEIGVSPQEFMDGVPIDDPELMQKQSDFLRNIGLLPAESGATKQQVEKLFGSDSDRANTKLD